MQHQHGETARLAPDNGSMALATRVTKSAHCARTSIRPGAPSGALFIAGSTLAIGVGMRCLHGILPLIAGAAKARLGGDLEPVRLLGGLVRRVGVGPKPQKDRA